jgi:hypothetical protein
MEKAESFQIYLNSKYASTYNNGLYNSDCDYILPQIELPSDYQIYLSVQSAMFPYSFYNIDTYNNIIIIKWYPIDNYSSGEPIPDNFNLTIPIGNYNSLQLATYITNTVLGPTGKTIHGMNDMTCTYNIITNRFEFKSTMWAFMFDYENSTALSFLGFPKYINKTITPTISYKSITTSKPIGDNIIQDTALLISTAQINLSTKQVLYVASNLSTGNILMTTKNSLNNNKNVLCSIPISSGPYTTISYVNTNNFSVNLYINILSTINIKILDIDGQLINFNNQYYSLTL